MDAAPVAIEWGKPLAAPAKLNLFLHVVGRRADGYHLLQTVFRLIDAADSLTFTPREDGVVRLATPLPGVPEEDDLVVRAARALQSAGGCPRGATVAVDKRLPLGGGLGGGSSDAATTLLALNRLWGLDLPRDRLAAIGLGLGADVPVFVRGRNAFAQGVGEVLEPLDLPPAWYLVLEPQVSVPTREIFADPALTRATEKTTIRAFFAGQQGRNDLEPVACRRYPIVASHLEWLRQQPEARGLVRMSGSGACVFAEFTTERDARAVQARLPRDMRGFVAKGLDRHPLEAASGG
jgi:4-diphosphocytidyl-2-C-methyl-D-erythritol kinase